MLITFKNTKRKYRSVAFWLTENSSKRIVQAIGSRISKNKFIDARVQNASAF